jgi:hypothetical protein
LIVSVCIRISIVSYHYISISISMYSYIDRIVSLYHISTSIPKVYYFSDFWLLLLLLLMFILYSINCWCITSVANGKRRKYISINNRELAGGLIRLYSIRYLLIIELFCVLYLLYHIPFIVIYVMVASSLLLLLLLLHVAITMVVFHCCCIDWHKCEIMNNCISNETQYNIRCSGRT